jgi:3'-phosphoadenosine 5'-phosphosulfate sulfotransferase (PAPS reductase)/FAD synthetase
MKEAIAFSGGKDSWALLWLNEKRLSSLPVIWVNTGKAYPETLAMITKARGMCGEFHEVITDQEGNTQRSGLPADIVPVNWTVMGQSITSKKAITVQPYISCCYQNITGPLAAKARELGVTHLILGQRSDEGHRAPYPSGTVTEGLVNLFPLEGWTERDVFDFLAMKMPIPPHFWIKHSSLDCYDCTAFTAESKDRLALTKERYPVFYEKYLEKKGKLDACLVEALNG